MNETLLPIDDERLTAYALNEVDAAERARIEDHLHTNPSAQKTVDAIRATVGLLTTELKRERFADLARAKPVAVPPRAASRAPSRKWTWIATAAAAVTIGLLGITYYGNNGQSKIAAFSKESPSPSVLAREDSVDFKYVGNQESAKAKEAMPNLSYDAMKHEMAKAKADKNEADFAAKVADSEKAVAPSSGRGRRSMGISSDREKDAPRVLVVPPVTTKAPADPFSFDDAGKSVGQKAVPLSPSVSAITVPSEVLRKTETGDHYESTNLDKNPSVHGTWGGRGNGVAIGEIQKKKPEASGDLRDTQSAFGNRDATIFSSNVPAKKKDGIEIPDSDHSIVSRPAAKNTFDRGIADDFKIVKRLGNELPPDANAAKSSGADFSKDNGFTARQSGLGESENKAATINSEVAGKVIIHPGGLNYAIGHTELTPSKPVDEKKLKDYEAEIAALRAEYAKAAASGKQPVAETVDAHIQLRHVFNPQPLPNTVQPGGETYAVRPENEFESVRSAPLSTFSVDVDTAAYSNVRRFLNQGQLPPPEAVRIEELINYFKYNYTMEKTADPFSTSVESAACPWNTAHRLVRVAVKSHELAENKRPASNLVFLIDVSGSMDAPNRLPLVKDGMKSLVRHLGETDRVAIVTYAGESGVALQSTTCADKDRIIGVIDSLQASGGTNGGAGIQTAYSVAKNNYIQGGVNRVILATDGDFNVGVTTPDALVKLIESESQSGVFLTALGYGMGNYKDAMLQRLADKGHGNYAYIDNAEESRKALVDQMNATLVAVAKDVKLQVEFNPARASEYRLIGYEKRVMPAQDFNNDSKDAGVLGAGHTVTAFYEVVLTTMGRPGVDALKYQARPTEPVNVEAGANPELLTVKIRYKSPEGNVSKRLDIPFTDRGEGFERATPEFKFAASVALFGQVLKRSPYVGNAAMKHVIEWADDVRGADEGGYRREFIQLARKAGELRGER